MKEPEEHVRAIDPAVDRSVEVFKIYGWEELHNMTIPELMEELRRWQDFESMCVAIGRPTAIKGLFAKIAELRRENALLRGELSK